jgi:hypothetical protein
VLEAHGWYRAERGCAVRSKKQRIAAIPRGLLYHNVYAHRKENGTPRRPV